MAVLHDFICYECAVIARDRVWDSEEDTPVCKSCGEPMEFLFARGRSYRPFPEFTTKHTVDGKERTFRSLQDIRKYEKENQDRGVCWEPGSYDTLHGEL